MKHNFYIFFKGDKYVLFVNSSTLDIYKHFPKICIILSKNVIFHILSLIISLTLEPCHIAFSYILLCLTNKPLNHGKMWVLPVYIFSDWVSRFVSKNLTYGSLTFTTTTTESHVGRFDPQACQIQSLLNALSPASFLNNVVRSVL